MGTSRSARYSNHASRVRVRNVSLRKSAQGPAARRGQATKLNQIGSTERREQIDGELHFLSAESDPFAVLRLIEPVERIAAERARARRVELTPFGHGQTEVVGEPDQQTFGHRDVEIVAASRLLATVERHQHPDSAAIEEQCPPPEARNCRLAVLSRVSDNTPAIASIARSCEAYSR